MSDIRTFVDGIFDELVAIRRDIHAHPETGMHETRTAALIRSELEKMGVDEIQQPLPTAVVALIHGNLTADTLWTLAVKAGTVLSASVNEGVMHACGHDLHTTMLLGAARTLCHMRDQFAGTVKLIFEPSEDLMPGGARALVAAGVMESPHVDAIFGQHVCPSENDSVGRMQLYKGYFTSAVDLFHITVHGKSAHASTPQMGIDAIVVAAELVTMVQTVITRDVDPHQDALLTLGKIQGGTSHNVIAEEVTISGTLRVFSNELYRTLSHKIAALMQGLETATGAQIDMDRKVRYPSVRNPRELVEQFYTVLDSMDDTVLVEPVMAAEDFAEYQQEIPGLFFFLGVQEPTGTAPLHSSHFNFDERVLLTGVETFKRILECESKCTKKK